MRDIKIELSLTGKELATISQLSDALDLDLGDIVRTAIMRMAQHEGLQTPYDAWVG